MTNNPTHAIVPIVATDAMKKKLLSEMVVDCEDSYYQLYDGISINVNGAIEAAISAAPPTNLVMVDKSFLNEVLDMVIQIQSESEFDTSAQHLERINKLQELLK